MSYRPIIYFWFREIDSKMWWTKDPDFDRLIAERFSERHAQASRCELYKWRVSPEGRLAEIIVLDQFSRNMYRDSPLAFAQDALALALAQEAVACKADRALTDTQRSFLYMPFMHSESLVIHDLAVQLFKDSGNEGNLNFEYKHQKIIEQFGRYPHRNRILGRESTPEEVEFLKSPNSGF